MSSTSGEVHSVETRDVEQAYLQADMRGPPVYISLPREMWNDKMYKMRCPVFPLRKALYGHKHSGVFWNEHCHEQCTKAGFNPISEAVWPCVYWNDELNLLLIVYVDDMKLAGPPSKMKGAWEEIGKHIKLEVPKGDVIDESPLAEKTMTFLGCQQTRAAKIIKGQTVQCMEYDISKHYHI